MTERAEVPEEIVARLRAVCLRLPDTYEEQAWVGTRWRVRKQTFAHVVMIDSGWPPAYARAAGTDGPVTVLTFRSSGSELAALGNAGHPFFKPQWFPDIVGRALVAGVDWDEIAELVIESYCVLAPKKLVALVNRARPLISAGPRCRENPEIRREVVGDLLPVDPRPVLSEVNAIGRADHAAPATRLLRHDHTVVGAGQHASRRQKMVAVERPVAGEQAPRMGE